MKQEEPSHDDLEAWLHWASFDLGDDLNIFFEGDGQFSIERPDLAADEMTYEPIDLEELFEFFIDRIDNSFVLAELAEKVARRLLDVIVAKNDDEPLPDDLTG